MPKAKVSLLKLSEACRRLSCCKKTFHRRWHDVFTDPRPAKDRRRSVERKVYDDELDLVISEAHRGVAAVYNYRRLMKRI